MPPQTQAQGLCRLCNNWSALRKSHAIPDFLFRRLFAKGSGSAIAMDSDPNSRIQRSQDSWDEPLLCGKCESKLNTQYDTYADRFSKRAEITVTQRGSVVQIANVDVQRLRMYFVSVLWRMAESSHENYRSVVLTRQQKETIAACLRENTSVSERLLSVRLHQLVDSSGSDAFSQDGIEGLITSPWCDVAEGTGIVTFQFFHIGYLVSVRFPGLSMVHRRKQGVLAKNLSVLMVPQIELLAIPKFMHLLMMSWDKQHRGHVSNGIQRISDQNRKRHSSGN